MSRVTLDLRCDCGAKLWAQVARRDVPRMMRGFRASHDQAFHRSGGTPGARALPDHRDSRNDAAYQRDTSVDRHRSEGQE